MSKSQYTELDNDWHQKIRRLSNARMSISQESVG